MPSHFTDALATLDGDLDAVARRWAATDELILSRWQSEDAALVLRDVSALARRTRDRGRELWYWWSL
jgi:hypothetical protein